MAKTLVRRRRQKKSRPRGGSDSVGKYFGDAWSLAKRTARGMNEIRKLINIETKAFDNYYSENVGQGAQVYCLSQIGQGTDYFQRVGDSIRLQHIEVALKVSINTSATSTLFRCIVFRDLDQRGSNPTQTTVLQQSGTSANTVLSPYQWLGFRDRIAVLFDEVVSLSVAGEQCNYIHFKEQHNGHIQYLNTTAAEASNGKGSIYLLYLSDDDINKPAVRWYSRINYTDD